MTDSCYERTFMSDHMLQTAEFRVHIPNFDGDGVAEVITIQIPVQIDPRTGEELMTEEGERLIEETKARHLGLLTPARIKAMRQRLGLKQKELAKLLQAGEKNFSRWESGGARPSRMVNVLLKAVDDGLLPIDYLRSLQPGAEPYVRATAPLQDWAQTTERCAPRRPQNGRTPSSPKGFRSRNRCQGFFQGGGMRSVRPRSYEISDLAKWS